MQRHSLKAFAICKKGQCYIDITHTHVCFESCEIDLILQSYTHNSQLVGFKKLHGLFLSLCHYYNWHMQIYANIFMDIAVTKILYICFCTYLFMRTINFIAIWNTIPKQFNAWNFATCCHFTSSWWCSLNYSALATDCWDFMLN